MSEKKGADAYAHTGTLAFLLSYSALVSYGNMVFAASEDKAVAGEEIKLTKEEKEIIKDSVEEIQLFIDEIHPFDCKDNVIYFYKIKSVCSVKSADFRVDTGYSKEGFTMDNFELVSEYKSTGDQLQANIIVQLNKPILIIAHNKTLAAQLYGEFKGFFPNNAVEYFVS